MRPGMSTAATRGDPKAWLLGGMLAVTVSAAAMAEGNAVQGASIFQRRCQMCHVADAEVTRIGPTLLGLFGRKAGSIEGFAYSDALKGKGEEGLVWTEDTLDAYLTNPKSYIPRNRMAFPGLKNPEERLDLIAYLEAVTMR